MPDDPWLRDLIRDIRMIRRMKRGHSFKRRHGDLRKHTVSRCYRGNRK